MEVSFDFLFTQSGTGLNTTVTAKNIVKIGSKMFIPGDRIKLMDEVNQTVDVFDTKKLKVEKQGNVYQILSVIE